ncbi:hypothetical protein [Paenibacillus tyrfis]|uniref:hypothetical protein n=1 Tax=Paenibacillus tyrfis TaxID=1501230 RepID=UPI00068D97B2|nr:hypothetical protein [Paenibacillus tyrfis]
MEKGMQRLSVILVLASFVSLFSAFTAMAAGDKEKRFETKNGGYVTISNIVETKKIKDVGYGETMYVATAPVTVTFYGELADDDMIAKWADEDSLEYVGIKNNKAQLTEPVKYGVFPIFKGQTRGDNDPILLEVVASPGEAKQPEATPQVKTEALSASPTPAKVLVNSKDTAFEAYNINGNNYFKLRDLAMSVNDSEKSFEVSWDAAKNAISLASNKAYTPEGNELTISGKPTGKQVTETTANLSLNGKEVKFTAYLIDGNNYFKLRDIAGLMNIGVTWDEKANAIRIDTKADYKE